MREVAELQPPGHRGRVGPADGGLPDMRRAALGPKFLEHLISFCTESPDGGADGLCAVLARARSWACAIHALLATAGTRFFTQV